MSSVCRWGNITDLYLVSHWWSLGRRMMRGRVPSLCLSGQFSMTKRTDAMLSTARSWPCLRTRLLSAGTRLNGTLAFWSIENALDLIDLWLLAEERVTHTSQQILIELLSWDTSLIFDVSDSHRLFDLYGLTEHTSSILTQFSVTVMYETYLKGLVTITIPTLSLRAIHIC